MTPPPGQPDDSPADAPLGDGEWFRPPTAREHRIGGWLFLGFGLFFFALFFVLAGWWFRWVICALGVYSVMHGIGHLRDARRSA